MVVYISQLNVIFFYIDTMIFTHFTYNNKYWYKNNKLYRNCDLPAVEYKDGTKIWYKDDLCHRSNDLPAVEYNDGDKFWYIYDRLHRNNNLPAIILNNGYKEWFKNGKKFYPFICLFKIKLLSIRIMKMGNKYWYIGLSYN